MTKCLECNQEADWERCTQFAGNHPYCDHHARLESDFNDSDSYLYWSNLREENLLHAADHVSDKGYELSTHEKQAEFAKMRMDSLTKDKPHILEIRNFEGKEIIKITYEGKIFWNQREVETDQDYRDAMMYVGKRLSGMIQ